MPPLHRSSGYNATQKYFLVTDLFILLFWSFVLCRLLILYPLTGSKFLPGGIADFYLSVLTGTTLLELFNYVMVFRFIPGTPTVNNSLPKPRLSVLLTVATTRVILAFAIFNYPKTARSEAFALLILVQSVQQLFRWFYNLQKVRLYNHTPWLNKITRSLAYLVTTPVESFCTFYILLQSLVYTSYQPELIPYDDSIKLVFKLILIANFPVFYVIYKRTLTKYFFSSQHIIAKTPQKED